MYIKVKRDGSHPAEFKAMLVLPELNWKATEMIMLAWSEDGVSRRTVRQRFASFRSKNLVAVFNAKLRLRLHIRSMANKARSTLRFVKRLCREYEDPYLTKSLFVVLIRTIPEYASTAWFPSYDCDIDLIVPVQEQFLRITLRGQEWSTECILPPHVNRFHPFLSGNLHFVPPL